jgi:hypothetical protein
MKANLFLFAFLISAVCKSYGQAPHWQWAKGSDGLGQHYVNDATVDLYGNSVMTGSVNWIPSTIVFDSITLTFFGQNNFFIAKHNSAGNVVWAKGADNAIGNGVCIDTCGNVYATGWFDANGTVFGNTNLYSNGSNDIFIVKYDSSGNVIWAKGFGDTGNDVAQNIAADDYGNIYITGQFNSASITFDSLNVITNASSPMDCFVLKLDSAGNVVWAKSAGGINEDYGISLTVDRWGNPYITGYFESDSISFDSITLNHLVNQNKGFVVKYDSSGIAKWAKSVSISTNSLLGNKITAAVDTNGNLYMTGAFNAPTISFDSIVLTNSTTNYMNDIYIVKFDSAGNSLWAKNAIGSSDDASKNIAIDKNGDLYVTGYFKSSSITFDSVTINRYGPTNIFAVKYSSSGNALWANSSSGPANAFGMGIGADAEGNVYLSGNFGAGGVIFDNIQLPSSSMQVFIAKLSCITNSTVNAFACNAFISPSGLYTWFTTGTYIDTVSNAAGCDSIITINLVINNNTSSTQAIVSCDNYLSPSGNYNWTMSGTYTDTIANSIGCDSIITINLTINNVDVAVMQSGNILSANASGANYQWLNCDSSYAQIIGETSQSFAPLVDGSYAVQVSQNGCIDTSSCNNILGLWLFETSYNSSIRIIQNPGSGHINITSSKIIDEIIIFKPLGQIIYHSKPNDKNLSLSIDHDGIYFITLTCDKQMTTRKIIVQH